MPVKVDEQALRKLRVDIVLAEYKARTDEITHLSTRYASLMMSIGVIISVVLFAAGIGFSLTGGIPVNLKPTADISPDFKRVFAVVLPSLILYLIVSAMDALHLIMINGLRRAELEKILNRLGGAELLIWDTHIYPQLFANINWLPRNVWIKPNLLQGLFLLVMTIAAFISCGSGFACYFGWFAGGYWICLGMVLLFVSVQWGMLVTKAAKTFKDDHDKIYQSVSGQVERSPSCQP